MSQQKRIERLRDKSMKLILHLVWNDLRRLRWWVVLWAALLLASDIFGFWLLYGEPPDAYAYRKDQTWAVASFQYGLIATQLLTGYLMTLVLVHGDPVIGTRAFWLTRPISGARQFAAKLTGVVSLLIVLPILVFLPWWLWCGFGWAEVALAAAKCALVGAAVGLLGAFVAAVTDSLSRALLWGGLLVPTVAVVFASLRMSGSIQFTVSSIVFPGALLVPVVLSGLSVTGAIAAHYIARRVGVMAVALVSGALLTVIVSGVYVLVPRQVEAFEKNPELATGVQLEVGYAYAAYTRRTSVDGLSQPMTWVLVNLTVTGLPPRTRADGSSTNTFMWPSGLAMQSNGSVHSRLRDAVTLGFGDRPPDAETEQWAKNSREEFRRRFQRTAPEKPARTLPEGEFRAVFALRPSIAKRVEMEKPSYRGVYHFRLLRPRVLDETDPQNSSWQASKSYGFRVTSAVDTRSSLDLHVVDTRPEFTIGALLKREEPIYVFLKRGPNEAVEPWLSPSSGRRIVVNSVEIAWRICHMADPVIRKGKWTDPETPWYEGATLARIVSDEVARFTREVKVEKFEVEGMDEGGLRGN